MAVAGHDAPQQRMAERVLIVDDDANVLDAYRRRLGRALHVDVCSDPVEALQLLDSDHKYAVIISDFLMPKLNGVQFLAKCKQKSPHSVRMMLTGISDFGTSVDAVNDGNVFRFLMKPCPPEVLGQALVDGIRQYRLEQAEESLVRNTLREAVRLAVDIAAIADPASFADARRLSGAVATVAAEVEPDYCTEIEIAWLLSGLGQLTVPAETLAKHRLDRGVTAEESTLLDRCRQASEMLARNIPQLETIAAMIEGERAIPSRAKRLPSTATSAGSSVLAVFRAIASLAAGGVPDSEIPSRLREAPDAYDRRVLEAVEACFEARGDAGFATPVALEELRIGDVLAADVRTGEGRVLAGAGTQLSYLLIERIRNFASLMPVDEPVSVLKPQVTVDID